jgi:Na+/H+ antiporter
MPKGEFLIALLVAVAGLARLASIIDVPYPVLLVLAGLGLAAIPGLPEVELDPELVFVVFLPPLLFHAAFLTSPREIRQEWRAIGLLAVGLVLLTLVVVAAVAHEVANLSWPEAFMLGAIVGPTDPVAATALFRRLGLPDRLTTILEGEALMNDGTALVAFRVAVAATTAVGFSLLNAVEQFVGASVAGVGVGLIAGWLITKVRRRVDDPQVEITLSLFTPYLAYIPAEHLGASGVLAAVTVGLYLAWQAPTGLFHPSSRLQATAFWDVLVFLLNSLLFILVGLQIRPVLNALGERPASTVAGAAAAVVAAVIVVRLVWMLVVPPVTYALMPGQERTSLPERLLLGWSGMRGALSLAAALSVPFDVDGRPLILFVTFVVILATLVGQGLTLPAVTRRLVPEREQRDDRAEVEARRATAEAALDLLDEIAAQDDVPPEAVRAARRRYELRLSHLDPEEDERTLASGRALQRRLAQREREIIERMLQDGDLDQATARRMERELDLEEERWSELEESALG